MCNKGYVEYDAETGEARQCGNPRCPDNRVRPTPPSRGLPIPAPHDEFPCRLSQKEPRASKFVDSIQMAVIQCNATPVSVALLTPKQSKPLRCRWILRGRKRFWIALRKSKTPQPQQPQYRPPFHPFDAHAHGSAACRGAFMLRWLDKCKQRFARSLHVSQSRSVSHSSSPSARWSFRSSRRWWQFLLSRPRPRWQRKPSRTRVMVKKGCRRWRPRQ